MTKSLEAIRKRSGLGPRLLAACVAVMAVLGSCHCTKTLVPDDPSAERAARQRRLDFWLKALEDPEAQIFREALVHVGWEPDPRAIPVLERWVAKPLEGQDRSDLFIPILATLSKDDSRETSQWLIGLLERVARTPRTDRRWRFEKQSAVDLAWEQLWRTGRTSEYGLCPAEVRTRHLNDVDQHTADGSIGTAHPLILQEISPDGRWVIVCQSRADTDGDERVDVEIGDHGDLRGDEMASYLVIGSGLGWRFDELVGSDPTGRYVAVREGACLSVVDTWRGDATTLPNADLRDDGRFGVHRAAAFDAIGARLVYLSSRATPHFVVRDLTTHREMLVDSGPGLVLSMRFSADGSRLDADVVPSGRWPTRLTTLAPRQCRGPVAVYSTFGVSREDEPVVRHVSLDVVMSTGASGRTSGSSARVELVDNWDAYEQGLLATRSDGAVLQVDSVAMAPSAWWRTMHVGPLRWRPAPRSSWAALNVQ